MQLVRSVDAICNPLMTTSKSQNYKLANFGEISNVRVAMNRLLRLLITAFTAVAFMASSVGSGMASNAPLVSTATENASSSHGDSECHPGHVNGVGNAAQAIICASLESSGSPIEHHGSDSTSPCCAMNCNVAIPVTCHHEAFSAIVSEMRDLLPDSMLVESIATRLDRPPRSVLG